MPKVILVTGATGKQGGSCVKSLLASGQDIEILAVTRNSQSAGAQKLAAKSPKIKVVQGDLDNPDAIFEAAKKVASEPIWGVFSVQALMTKDQAAEETQGKALHTASIANNVKFIVYTSVDRHGSRSDTNPTNVPHFATKHNIEQHLFKAVENTSTQYTVLRPVAFMDNYDESFAGRGVTTLWKSFLKETPWQLIACSDIGHFAALAFLDPGYYAGKKISLAGDELTFSQGQKVYKEVTGREMPLMFDIAGRIFLWTNKEIRLMFQWFKDEGYAADIPELKKLHPGLKTYGDWLKEDLGLGKK